MKKILLTMAAALALVSCSQDDLMQGIENRPTGAISAKVFVPTVTRGTALNNEGDLVNSDNGFDLYAFRMDTHGQFMGNGDGGNNVGVPFVGSEIDGAYMWDYENKSQMYFWSEAEGNEVKFYAVSPKNSLTDGFLTKTVYHDNMTLNYTSSTICREQVDLMYAVTDNLSSTDGNHIENGIDLQFHHALSQIVFNAKTESALIYADVTDVKIKNVYQEASFATIYAEPYRIAEDKSSAIFPWDNYDVLTDYTAELMCDESYPTNINTLYDEDGNETHTTSECGKYNDGRLTDSSEALLLIPQNLESNNTVLSITCSVRFNGENGDVIIVDNQTIEVPVTTNWQPGYKYTYTLIFTAEMGNPIKVQSANVDIWNDSGNTDVDVNGENGESNTLPAMELEPTGLYFKDGNILVGSADDLLAIAKYTGNRTVEGIGGGVYWLGEADDDGKQQMYDLQYEDNDESDNSTPAPSDWTENDVIELIYNNMWNESSCLQTNEIDLLNVNYTPIVVGTYDGDNHSVSNLTLTSDQALIDEYDSKYGCFVYARDAVKNLHMKSLKIGTSTSDFDYAGAFCDADVVANCSVDENSIIYGNQVAGICCYPGTTMDEIKNCVNKATIIADYSGVGICIHSFNVTNCVNRGSVSGNEAAGILQSISANYTISNCHNYGDIYSRELQVGGIAARADEGVIQYCHNEGSVQAENNRYLPGAIVGYSHPVEDSYTDISLTGCYNVKQDLSLVGSIQYGHSYDDSQNGDALTISFTSCYNTAGSANALVGLFYKDAENDDVVRPFTLTITDCYYTNATVAYSLEGVDENKATVPDSNTCIKLDNSDYSWEGTPMTKMNSNLSEYSYQNNSNENHPLKLSGESTAE